MSRLTERFGQNATTKEPVYIPAGIGKKEGNPLNEIVNKLGRLEDLEEAGRLIELPCKVGDTVYGRMHNYKVIGFADNELLLSYGIEGELYPTRIPFAHIGKTVFLTKAEAEVKLAELKGGAE